MIKSFGSHHNPIHWIFIPILLMEEMEGVKGLTAHPRSHSLN